MRPFQVPPDGSSFSRRSAAESVSHSIRLPNCAAAPSKVSLYKIQSCTASVSDNPSSTTVRRSGASFSDIQEYYAQILFGGYDRIPQEFRQPYRGPPFAAHRRFNPVPSFVGCQLLLRTNHSAVPLRGDPLPGYLQGIARPIHSSSRRLPRPPRRRFP